jgi:inhibitor of KinA
VAIPTLKYEFSPLGDRALLIHLGDTIDDATHRRVRAVCARLDARAVPGMIELVPAFASVAVHYEPGRVAADALGSRWRSPYERLAESLHVALAHLGDSALPTPREVTIPVCYGDSYGPDLADVASQHELTPGEVVALHTGGTYNVYMLGFAPGFAYLGGLAPEIATPRRAEPRTAVPAGSVGIGGSQTGIYPLLLPGGWQLIGRTPLRMFDARREPATLLAVGDRVRFTSITSDEFQRLAST